MPPTMRATLILMAALAMLALSVSPPAHARAAKGAPAPVGSSGGVLASGLHSDQVAWQRFTATVAPAGKGRVAYETWAADEDIYTATPAWPGEAALERKRLRQGLLQRMVGPHALRTGGADSHCGAVVNAAAGNFPPRLLGPGQQPCYSEEVRRNLASYRYIVQNQLNTQAGLAAAFKKAQSGWRVALPEDAVEVKADWVPVDTIIAWMGRNGVALSAGQVRAQYYTTVSQGTSFALVSLHISAKDAPNWLWASFEHRRNPGRCDTMGCNDRFGSEHARIAPARLANTQYPPCTRTAALEKMARDARLAEVWGNYCLKASEIAFVTAEGAPLMNGGSFTERVAAGIPINKSSCIACHASAGFGRDGRAYTKLMLSRPMGNVQLPPDVVANDFNWGILSINTAAPDDRAKIAARR